MKRFYDRVSLEENNGLYTLKLDERELLTPMGRVVCHRNYALMQEVANEWQLQVDKDKLEVSNMGLSCLVHGLIDGVRENRREIIDESVSIFQTDLVLYRAELGRDKHSDELRARQDRAWDSVVRNFEVSLGLTLKVLNGVIYDPQDSDTITIVRSWLEGLTEDILLIVFTVASRCGSLVLGHAALEGMEADKIWDKYVVEEKLLIEKTLEDEEQNSRLEEIKVELGYVEKYREFVL